MNNSEDISRAKKALRRRLDELNRIWLRAMKASQSAGKAAVVEVLCEEFSSEAIVRGNDVQIGQYLAQFDGNGSFQGLSSVPRRPTTALRKQP